MSLNEDEAVYMFDSDEVESLSDDDEYLLTDEDEEKEISNIHIKEDFESVVTLSTASEITLNKKIQQIRQTIDTLLSSTFTLGESIKIHSIYNFNPKCLQNRNKFLQEFVLIIVFLEHIGICFTKHIASLVFPKMLIFPKKKNYEKTKVNILSSFNFENFESCNEKDEVSLLVQKHAAGLFFYIKNRLLLLEEDEFTSDEKKTLLRLLLSSKELTFVSDPKLQIGIQWVTRLMRNLIVFNFHTLYNDPNGFVFKKKKTKEYFINTALRIVLSFISECNSSSFESKTIRCFLLYHDESNYGEALINNSTFQIIIKSILTKFKKEETLKFFKKQFVAQVKQVLGSDTPIE